MNTYPTNRAGRRRMRKTARAGFVTVAASGCAALALAFSSNGVAAAAVTPDSDGYDCDKPGYVFIVGGTWNSSGTYLQGVDERYTGQWPASPVAEDDKYGVKYVNYSATIWPLGEVGYNASEAEGAAALKDAVADYQEACPDLENHETVIAGYSQGARVAGDVLTDIGNGEATSGDRTISSENVRGELYADPRQSGDLWGRGIEQTLLGVIPGLTMSGPRDDDDFGGVPVTTLCVQGDPICDLPDPLHDPIGVIDGFLGYWVKHNTYPWHAYQPPGQDWSAGNGGPAEVICVQEGTVNRCVVQSPSSTQIIVQQMVDALGIDWDVPDLVADRLTIPSILGITLADFQPPVRYIYDLLPQLPQLGYGGYLPDLYAFRDILVGFVTIDGETFIKGVRAVGNSAVSIVLMPVNAVRYWAGEIFDGIESLPNTTSATVASSEGFAASAADEEVDGAAAGDDDDSGNRGTVDTHDGIAGSRVAGSPDGLGDEGGAESDEPGQGTVASGGQPGGEQPGGDHTGAEQPGGGQSGAEQAGGELSGGELSGDETGGEESDEKQSAADQPGESDEKQAAGDQLEESPASDDLGTTVPLTTGDTEDDDS